MNIVVIILLVIYMLSGISTLVFYLIDFKDEKMDVSKACVSIIALFLFPLFWFIRQLLSSNFKL